MKIYRYFDEDALWFYTPNPAGTWGQDQEVEIPDEEWQAYLAATEAWNHAQDRIATFFDV